MKYRNISTSIGGSVWPYRLVLALIFISTIQSLFLTENLILSLGFELGSTPM